MILAAASSVGAPLAPPLELSAAFNPKPVHVQLRELAARKDAALLQMRTALLEAEEAKLVMSER